MNDINRLLSRTTRRAVKALRLLEAPLWRRGLKMGVGATIEHDALPLRDSYRTVIDVGAHKGQFALYARQRFPRARLYCFEPLPGPRSKLAAVTAGDEMVHVAASAVGAEEGSATMHVSGSDDSSSLLAITKRQSTMFPGTSQVAETSVPVVALDAFFRTTLFEAPVLLKIDVQGFELEVLKGACELLSRVDSVLVECSFVEFYAGQPLFEDVQHFLSSQGFALRGGHISTQERGVWMQGDFVFERGTEARAAKIAA